MIEEERLKSILNKENFIAGHNGMVGSAVLRLFKKKGYKNNCKIKRIRFN